MIVNTWQTSCQVGTYRTGELRIPCSLARAIYSFHENKIWNTQIAIPLVSVVVVVVVCLGLTSLSTIFQLYSLLCTVRSLNAMLLIKFLLLWRCLEIIEPRHEKPVLPYAKNEGADQPAHPRSLNGAFVVRCLDSIIHILANSLISRL